MSSCLGNTTTCLAVRSLTTLAGKKKKTSPLTFTFNEHQQQSSGSLYTTLPESLHC